MPRGIQLDLTPAIDRIDVAEILPSPPPAYTQLPAAEGDDDKFEDAIEDGEDEDEDSSLDEDDLDSDDQYEYDEAEWDGEPRIDKELVNDQDWENAAGDLTKRYNRLRQHVGALTGEKQRQTHATTHQVVSQNGSTAASSSTLSRMPLPAQNQHRVRKTATTQSTASSKDGLNNPDAIHASKLDSSLAQLSQRYAAALNLAPVASTSSATAGSSNAAYAAEPSFTSNAATRKGGSERHHVIKDKSDRATNEQVLDPRTRLVLFKMLNRGLLEKVEGCVSTGKEVRSCCFPMLVSSVFTKFSFFRPTSTMP